MGLKWSSRGQADTARSKAENGILRKADGSDLLIGDMHRLILRLVAEHGLNVRRLHLRPARTPVIRIVQASRSADQTGETIVFDFYPCGRAAVISMTAPGVQACA